MGENPTQVSQPSDLNGEFGFMMKIKGFRLSFGQTATDLTVLLFLLQLLTHPYPKADRSLAHRPRLWDPLVADSPARTRTLNLT